MGMNAEDAAAHCQLASLSLEAHLVARGNNHGVKLSGVNSWEMRVLCHNEHTAHPISGPGQPLASTEGRIWGSGELCSGTSPPSFTFRNEACRK